MRKTTMLMAGLLACLLCAGCAVLGAEPTAREVWVHKTDKSAAGVDEANECRRANRTKVDEFARGKCPRGDASRIRKYEEDLLRECMEAKGFHKELVYPERFR